MQRHRVTGKQPAAAAAPRVERRIEPHVRRERREPARASPLARAGPRAPTRGSESQQERDDRESEAFWREFAADAAVHAAKSEKAAKVIRDCIITRKAAGRSAPAKVLPFFAIAGVIT